MRKRSSIEAAYDLWSATYDTQTNPTRDLDALALRAILPPLEEKTVLEIGCGTGKNSAWLAPRCARLIAVDFSAGMLSLARRKVQSDRVAFMQADIQRPLPLAGALADLALINLVLEHIADLPPVMRHVAAQMAPGAVLILSEYHPDRLLPGKGARIDRPGQEPLLVGSFRHSLEEFDAALRLAGLEPFERRLWHEHQLPGGVPADRDTGVPLIFTVQARKA